MSTIDLVALDLDGTLLNPDESISPANRAAIAATLAAGVRIVLVTGRGVDTPAQVAAELGLDLPVICAHGALTLDFMTKQIIGHIPVQLRYARPMVEYAQERHLGVIAYVDQFFYRLDGAPSYMDDMTGPNWRSVPNLVDILNEAPTFLRFLGHDAVTDIPTKFYDFPLHFKIESWGDFEECAVTSIDATKSNALARLCKELNVPANRVMAVGDSRNDVPMMQWAGIGVAMGNALPEVKDAVDHITDRNTEDGVAHALERYVLEPISRRKKSA